MDNLVLVTFKEEESLNAALDRFEEQAVTDEYAVLQAAVLLKRSGRIRRSQNMRLTGDDTGYLTNDLIDSVAEVLEGPVGSLIGGYGGPLRDADMNANQIVEESGMLEAIAAKLNENEWAVIALVQERNEISLSSRLNSLGASAAVRKDAARVAYEVMNARDILREYEERGEALDPDSGSDELKEKIRGELRERANRGSFEQEQAVRDKLRGDFEYLHSRVPGWQGRREAPSAD